MSVYLNHAGTSWPKPACVKQAIATALEQTPVEWGATFETAHEAIAQYFGIADPARLLLTPGCTSALAVAIADLPWRSGDVVVTSGLEHHALHRPLLALASQGVELVVVPPHGNDPIDLDVLTHTLSKRRVRLVALSAVSNVTGAIFPIAKIVGSAHRHGALVLIDAAQGAGWLPLNVRELGVDMLAFAGHKALQGPWGIGGLYCARPLHASPRLDGSITDAPGYCDTGSVDRLAMAGLVAGMNWLRAPAREGRLAMARRQVSRLQQCALEAGAQIIGPKDVELRTPTLALRHPRHSANGLAGALRRRGVVASGGHQCAFLAHQTLETEGALRLSVGPTTRDGEIDKACQALTQVLAGKSP